MPDKLNNSFSLLFDKLKSWLDAFVLHLPNLLVAIIVIAVMFFASKYVSRWTRKLVGRFTKKKSIIKLISNVISGVLIFIAFVLVLTILDLEETVTSLLAGAGILGLVAGLAFQDALTNTFAGIVISVKDLFSINDHIVVEGLEGKIKEIGFRFTTLINFTGQIVIIPNKVMVEHPVVNYSITGSRRVDLDCSVAYSDDLQKAQGLAIKAIQDSDLHEKEKGVQMFYTSFGDSAINFSLRFWLNEPKSHPDYLKARSEAIIKIRNTFDENGITIPFPIRTLEFDSSSIPNFSKTSFNQEPPSNLN